VTPHYKQEQNEVPLFVQINFIVNNYRTYTQYPKYKSYIHFILIYAMLLVNIVSQSGEQTKRVLTGPRLIMSPVCIDSSKSTEIKSWNDKKLNYLIFS